MLCFPCCHACSCREDQRAGSDAGAGGAGGAGVAQRLLLLLTSWIRFILFRSTASAAASEQLHERILPIYACAFVSFVVGLPCITAAVTKAWGQNELIGRNEMEAIACLFHRWVYCIADNGAMEDQKVCRPRKKCTGWQVMKACSSAAGSGSRRDGQAGLVSESGTPRIAANRLGQNGAQGISFG